MNLFGVFKGFTAFCQSENSSIGLLVNCLMVQSAPMKVQKNEINFQ